MSAYILRRLLYAIPLLIGVNLITFALFFVVNTPDDIARMHLGNRNIDQQDVESWKQQHGYNYPILYNSQKEGLEKFTQTLFVRESLELFLFNFGRSDGGRNIGSDIKQRALPSLAIAIPTLLIGVAFNITFAFFMVFFRATYVDYTSVILCAALMSISSIFYIIMGQFLFSKILKLAPISGYDTGLEVARFLVLPVLVGVLSGIGAGSRWYRTIFLEEIGKPYVKTARAKGLQEAHVLFKHVLRNALIPILTGIVVVLPVLFMGSLIIESFFGIPGLGSYTIEAIIHQDFAIVRSMVFLGSILYIAGLLLTDISYALVDPRVRFS